MSNEFNGTDNDQAWVALTANDPAKHLAKPELDALKASVLSEAIKVAPISKRSWLAPVAVAASVALFVGGGAGYTIAAQSSSDSNFVYAPISAPERGSAAGAAAQSSSDSNFVYAPISAPERGSAAGAQDAKMSSSSMWGWGGRAYLEADSGISDTSGVQVGYTFDASDIDRKAQLEVIANTFSVEGKIIGSKSDGYFVGDQNYVNAVAQISGANWDLSQLVTWNYSDSAVNPVYCGGDMPMYDTKSSAGTSSTTEEVPTSVSEPVPAPIECETPSGTLPSDESALALAKEKFSALNFDSEAAAWTVVDNGNQWGYGAEIANAYKLVTAKVLVDGLTTNQSWTMTVGPDSAILNANGFFAKFIPTSEYNIVGAKTAIERSQNALWANLAAQEVYREGMIYPMEMGISSNPSAVVRNQAGQPVLDATIDRITISKAETSLISWYLNDGSTILLPAYLLSETQDGDSRQWLQLAIADEYIDFS